MREPQAGYSSPEALAPMVLTPRSGKPDQMAFAPEGERAPPAEVRTLVPTAQELFYILTSTSSKYNKLTEHLLKFKEGKLIPIGDVGIKKIDDMDYHSKFELYSILISSPFDKSKFSSIIDTFFSSHDVQTNIIPIFD